MYVLLILIVDVVKKAATLPEYNVAGQDRKKDESILKGYGDKAVI